MPYQPSANVKIMDVSNANTIVNGVRPIVSFNQWKTLILNYVKRFNDKTEPKYAIAIEKGLVDSELKAIYEEYVRRTKLNEKGYGNPQLNPIEKIIATNSDRILDRASIVIKQI